MVKVVGVIKPLQTQEIHAEADNYTDAKMKLEAEVPEGWQLVSMLTVR